jgi:NAD(P)-dependent dehydrogenase (short-subunit alcohol dehydrogenase family)
VCECNQAHSRQGSRHQSTFLNRSNVEILPAPEASGAAGARAVYCVTEAARLIQSVPPDACLAAVRSFWANIPSMTVSSSIGRAGSPEEIASVVLWLCSRGASYVIGHALTVDGGMTEP